MTQTHNATLVVERVYHHSAEKIWRALTETELVDQWLVPGNFRATEGHHFTLKAPPVKQWDGLITGEVLTVQPPHLLAYTWKNAGNSPDGLQTVVTWTLTPTTDGVLVRMEQRGFRPEQELNYQGALMGWQRFLAKLHDLLDKADSSQQW